MSEELYALALLWLSGFSVEEVYSKTLDSRFLQSDLDDDLLYLESERDLKKAMLYIITHFRVEGADERTLWHCLTAQWQRLYKKKTADDFARKLYELWKLLPDEISLEDPFHMISYADEPLSWGDTMECCRICEEIMAYTL